MNPKYTARDKYDKAHTHRIFLKLNVKTDFDILCKLSEQKNRQGYIKALIRKDILENPPVISGK